MIFSVLIRATNYLLLIMARYSTGLSYYLTESCLGLGSLNIETQKRMWMLEVFLGNDLRKQQVGSGEDETGEVRHVSEK